MLCRVAATKQASTLRSDIAVIAREALMRLDQEIICGAGSVQWREPTTAETDELLEKRQGGVDSMT
nr:phosphoribosyl-dephospho-CoA transferase MdcG domain-containing protein [Bradyrhizobium centrosematis]